jgi:hypothetical protein
MTKQPLSGSVFSQFLPSPYELGPKSMSVEASAFVAGLSMVLMDGKGWPFSSPDPVTGS